MSITNLSIEQLNQAISIKEEIATLEAKLAKLIGGTALQETVAEAPIKQGRRKMSAAAKAKIATAQKARWAKQKRTAPAHVVVKAAKPAKRPKRKMSAEGRARIVAALKARWAKAKGAKAPAKAAASKPVKKKVGLTPAGRAKLAAAMRARWAAKKTK